MDRERWMMKTLTLNLELARGWQALNAAIRSLGSPIVLVELGAPGMPSRRIKMRLDLDKQSFIDFVSDVPREVVEGAPLVAERISNLQRRSESIEALEA